MRKIISTILIAITLLLSVGMAFSAKAGASDQQLLYLYEKEPVNWTIVEDGAWGKMRLDSDDFVFNGHGIVPGQEYALIVYDEDSTGDDVFFEEKYVLAVGVANNGGNLNLKGELPTVFEAKIWLVPTTQFDVDTGFFTAWAPEEILFENERVTN